MSPSSPHRGQVEPVAALVAVIAVTVGIGLYAGVVDDAMPDSEPSKSPATTLTRVIHAISTRGIVEPRNLTQADLTPILSSELAVNITLRATGQTWSLGPTPPSRASAEAQTVPVRVQEAVVPGRIRVVVWT